MTERLIDLTDDAPRRYGLMTVEGHRAHLRITGENLHVYVDGADVSPAGVIEADDIAGYAIVLCRDTEQHARWSAQGFLHIRYDTVPDGEACKLRLTGRIELRPGPPIVHTPQPARHGE